MSAGVNDCCQNQRMRQEQEIEKLKAENTQLKSQLFELTKRVQVAESSAKAVNLTHLESRTWVFNTLAGQNLSPEQFSARYSGSVWK